MKEKIFRIAILLLSTIPACLAFGMTWIGLFESFGIMTFVFGSAVVIYCEYVYNTIKLFKGDSK